MRNNNGDLEVEVIYCLFGVKRLLKERIYDEKAKFIATVFDVNYFRQKKYANTRYDHAE